MMKNRSLPVGLGLFLVILIVGAAVNTPLNRPYLQTDMNANGKSITNGSSLIATNLVGLESGTITNLRMVRPYNTTFTNLATSGDMTVGDDLLVQGDASFQGAIGTETLTVNGQALFQGPTLATDQLTLFAPLNLGQGADPATLTNGMVWYRTDLNELRARVNGVTVILGDSLEISDITHLTNLTLVTPKDASFTNLTVEDTLLAQNITAQSTLSALFGANFEDMNATGLASLEDVDVTGLFRISGTARLDNLTVTNTLAALNDVTVGDDATVNDEMTAGTVNSPNGRFNVIRMTNGAAADAIIKGDANGNFSWTSDFNVGGTLTLGSVSKPGALLVATNSAGSGAYTTESGSGPNENPWWVQNTAWRECQTATGSSGNATFGYQAATYSAGSSLLNAPGTNMACFDMTSSTSSNNAVGFYSENSFSAAASIQHVSIIAITNIANVRAFVGLTRAGNQNTMVQSDTPNIDAVGFQYVSNGTTSHTTWQYFTCDNSTTSSSDSSVTVTTNAVTLAIVGNHTGTKWDFYINGNFIGSKSSNTPRTSQTYAVQSVLSTQTTAVRTIRHFLSRTRTRINL